jgi:5-methylcytosine-specific restriction endonuclease McrA
MRAPKICNRPGCRKLGVNGTARCIDHPRPAWQGSTRKDTGGAPHKAWRAAVLVRDAFRCQIRGPGCLIAANEADHIEPVYRGGARFDVANGQAACRECHGRKSASEGGNARSGNVSKPAPPQPVGRRNSGPARIIVAPKTINMKLS